MHLLTAAFAAHLALRGRHHHTVVVGGWWWRYCAHRSHRTGARCWRWHVYDGQCARHTQSCWAACPASATRRNR